MTAIGQRIIAAAGMALLCPLSGCGGSSSSVQYTNDATTEQLNQIADNTSDTAGSGQAQDATDVRQGMGVATKPRQY